MTNASSKPMFPLHANHGAAALAAHKIAEARRRRSNANLLLAITGWRWCSNRWQQVSTHALERERVREQGGQLLRAAHGRSRQGAKGMLHNCQERCKKKVTLPLPTSPKEEDRERERDKLNWPCCCNSFTCCCCWQMNSCLKNVIKPNELESASFLHFP